MAIRLDLNQLAKRIVDEATGEKEKAPAPKEKDAGAVERGKARAKKLTQEQRSDIARNAAKKRWSKAKQSEAMVSETPSQKRHRIDVSNHSD